MKNEAGLDAEIGESVFSGRFVLLHHHFPLADARKSHWDLMLQQSSNLLTFQIPTLPAAISDCQQKLNVLRLSDHRIRYLDYEGPISGDRGYVDRVASGNFMVEKVPPHDLFFTLDSPSLKASFRMRIPKQDATTDLLIDLWETRDS